MRVLKILKILKIFRIWLKNLPAMQETQVRPLGWEDPLEKEMATCSSILVCEISWTEEPGGPQSIGLQRVRQNWVAEHENQGREKAIAQKICEWAAEEIGLSLQCNWKNLSYLSTRFDRQQEWNKDIKSCFPISRSLFKSSNGKIFHNTWKY